MTSTIARYDVHAANHVDFDPADYKFVGAIDTHPSPFFRANDSRGRRAIEAMETEGFPYAEVHPYGQCDHCGQHLRYIAVMFHHPSAALIQVGMTCLGNRFTKTWAEIKRMMAEAKAAREAAKIREAFDAACDANPALVWATYALNIDVATPGAFSDWNVMTQADIARKARHYGSISPRQVAFLNRLIDELDEQLAAHIEREAAKAAARAESGPAPTGRVAVEGTVTKTEERYNDFGVRTVMSVVLDNGARVWGTAPKAIAEDVETGSRVAFTATFEQGDDEDETFAFFSRPVRARLI